MAVGVTDLPHFKWLWPLHQLVAGGHDPHPGLGPHLHLVHAQAGEHPQVPGGQYLSRFEHRLAHRQVLAGPANVVARGHRLRHCHRGAVSTGLGELNHDHRVRAGGDHRAGHDARRLPGSHGHVGRRTCGNRARDGQGHRGVGHISRPHREAVHSRVVERGHQLGCQHGLGGHQSSGVVYGHDRLS